MARIKKILNPDGTLAPFDEKDIIRSIYQASVLAGAPDYELAEELAEVVIFFIERNFTETYPTHEDVSEWVERVLLETADPEIAKAFILWREEQKKHDDSKSSKSFREPSLFEDFEISVVGSDNKVSLWDRRKIHEDLIVKTGIARKVAEDIASSVEDKVFAIGKAKITSKLVRALIDAELIELGYFDIQSEHEPAEIVINDIDEVFQRGRFGDNKPPMNTARDIDEFLSRKIMQQYGVRRIFSPPVIEALEKGQIYSKAFSNPLKFRKVIFTLDCLKSGIPGESAPSNFDEFTIQLVSYIYQLFEISESVEIHGFTWSIAPLMHDLSGDIIASRYERLLLALTQFKSKNLKIEISYKAPNLVDKLPALDFNKGVIHSGQTIGEFNTTIKQLASLTFDLALRNEKIRENLFYIFKFSWGDVFQTENAKILENSTICASEFGNVRYQLEEENIKGLLNSTSQKTQCVFNSMSLNLPQAAYNCNNNDNVFTENFEQMLALAIQGIAEHHVFLSSYFNRFNTPIFKNSEHPASISIRDFTSEINLMGLTPAIMYMQGEKKRWESGKKGKRRGFDTTMNLFEDNKPIDNEVSKTAVKYLSYMQFKLKEELESLDFRINLKSESDYDPCEFFWNYDSQNYASNIEYFIFKDLIDVYPAGFEIIDDSMSYTHKAREQARITGIIGGKEVVVNSQIPSLTPQEILNLMKSVFSIKTTRQLIVTKPVVRCLSCGKISLVRDNKPQRCIACESEILQSGEMYENQFFPREIKNRFESTNKGHNPEIQTL